MKGVLVSFALALPAVPAFAAPEMPNIPLVFSDDHAIQAIGAYGFCLAPFCGEHKVTPNIDRLAARARRGGRPLKDDARWQAGCPGEP